jgi:Sulfatase-modifying factor enzyme 1
MRADLSVVVAALLGVAFASVLSGCESLAGIRDVKLVTGDASVGDDSDGRSDQGIVDGDATLAPDGDGSSASDAAEDSDAKDGGLVSDPGCPVGAKGPPMAMVSSGYDAGVPFCIDRTEVTGAQYQAFVASAPSVALPGFCAGRTIAAPSSGYALGTLPQGTVHFCDAAAYCTWAGKRLCETKEWTWTCSQGKPTHYPYGDSYVAGNCVDNGPLAQPVASFPNCRGQSAPFDGVYDLSGNIDEWVNECDDTATPIKCYVRGGFYGDTASSSYLTCDTPYLHAIDEDDQIGIRCCADSL